MINKIIPILCRLRSIAVHMDHFVRRLSVCLSGSHIFMVVTHAFLEILSLILFDYIVKNCHIDPNISKIIQYSEICMPDTDDPLLGNKKTDTFSINQKVKIWGINHIRSKMVYTS